MKLKSYILPFAALLAVGSFTACQDDYEDVENRVFDDGALSPSTVLVDGLADEATQSFTVEMANPSATEVKVTYAPDFSKVEAYNTIYNQNAIALPEANFEIKQPTAIFDPGKVNSSAVQVVIKGLLDLDVEGDKVYVLPLVGTSNVPLLPSMTTRYIVVRGAALINVVAGMTELYAALNEPSQATGLDGLTDFTAQCLVYINEFGGADSNIQTLLGVEGYFLLRISDSGMPADQIQLATNRGNSTDASWKLEAKKWQAITFTFKSSTGEATMYINGVKKATCVSSYQTVVNWANPNHDQPFYIGRSWNTNRWLNGNISEVRVWNRILTDAEIAEPSQPYYVETDSEGLVSYWKFNEGAGNLIQDYTSGYNCTVYDRDQKAAAPKWVEVQLPEK
ncbi:MAG: DUF1735 and LamG domain-containing protein [Firmicutes bacterium]|nr:DUF1735 and LamG domain-containing protein [Bacillota bacterium]MCM1400745.1 DUF1735 and LamG domain-containing protein [Bacteroides sp.]MCM1476836.1 DUF1735 and LamG domain-containing protein [Bacteroides sp.]